MENRMNKTRRREAFVDELLLTQIQRFKERLASLLKLEPIRKWWQQMNTVTETSFDESHAKLLKERLEHAILQRMDQIYSRLLTQQTHRNAMGLFDTKSNRIRLESQFLVDIRRFISVPQIQEEMKRVIQQEMQEKVQEFVQSFHYLKAKDSTPSTEMAKTFGTTKRRGVLFVAAVGRITNEIAAAKAAKAKEVGEGKDNLESNLFDANVPATIELMDCQLERTKTDVPWTFATVDFSPLQVDVTSILARYDAIRLDLKHFQHRTLNHSATLVQEEQEEQEKQQEEEQEEEQEEGQLAKALVEKPALVNPRLRYLMEQKNAALPHLKPILEQYAVPDNILEIFRALHESDGDENGAKMGWHEQETKYQSKVMEGSEMVMYYRDIAPSFDEMESNAIESMRMKLEIPIRASFQTHQDLLQEQSIRTTLSTSKDHSLSLSSIEDSPDDFNLQAHVQELFHETREVLPSYQDEVYRPVPYFSLLESALKCSVVESSSASFASAFAPKDNPSLPENIKPERRLPDAFVAWQESNPACFQKQFTLEEYYAIMDRWQQHHPVEFALIDAYQATSDAHESFDPCIWPHDVTSRWKDVWERLLMSEEDQLSLVCKYTDEKAFPDVLNALLLWEKSADFIEWHESVVRECQEEIEAYPSKFLPIDFQCQWAFTLHFAAQQVIDLVVYVFQELGDFVSFQGQFYLERLMEDHDLIYRVMTEKTTDLINQEEPIITTASVASTASTASTASASTDEGDASQGLFVHEANVSARA